MPNANNLKGKGFESRPENINKKGRPISIKNELKELMLKNGEICIPLETLIKKTDNYYIFKLPTLQTLALKLVNTAMNENANGFNALKLLLETFDGKAKQSIDADFNQKQIIEFKNVSRQFPDE